MEARTLIRRLMAGRRAGKTVSDRAQLQQLVRHLGMLAENVEEAVAVVNAAGVMHFANTRWAAMHGCAEGGEVLGRHLGEFFPPGASRRNIKALIKQARQEGRCDLFGRHLRKDGSIISTELKMTALRDDKGICEGIMVFARPHPQKAKSHHDTGCPVHTTEYNHRPPPRNGAGPRATGVCEAASPHMAGFSSAQLKDLKEIADLARRLK